nr:laccase domain-containing protein [Burkholderiaceae bacterium]
MKSLEPAQSAWPASWLEPDWPVPSHVRAVCTSREGGTSTGPWGSLNLGGHVADVPAAVQANRAVLAQAVGAQPIFMRQVHGVDVAELPGAGDAGDTAIVADACVTTAMGVACTVMVADCLPVLLANTAGTVVAAAHAGWRGLAGEAGQGVLESVYQRFSALAHDGCAQGAIN